MFRLGLCQDRNNRITGKLGVMRFRIRNNQTMVSPPSEFSYIRGLPTHRLQALSVGLTVMIIITVMIIFSRCQRR